MINRFSLHKIQDINKIPFSPIDYSKFKFGCKNISKEFGISLAKAFAWEYVLSGKIADQIVVVSSPYCFIPTATFAMKDYFVQELNQWLVQAGKPVVEETKIHRTITYREDYGELSAEQRLTLIQNDGFHIDAKFIEGKSLILLDDIRITGSHEKMIERMCDEYNLKNVKYYTYFAELVNQDIDPKIENFLNYAYVKNLDDLDSIIKNENFLLNTRMVKYMLNSDPIKFLNFAKYQKVKFLETVYHLAIGNSYHTIPEYWENLTLIKSLIK